ncbi:d9700179-c303-4dd7-8453-972e6aa14a3d [Sclerotinia trifoliorum]|uniref:D9700179-c303-4dd7-8453-972e6aa14a3d n=1 Tax=Sclerotinia trifoliorum TaxID=28548 RepID=A0A8H2VPK4_9HELO|nr:d9700179-c303-4dd7-8453-972e6aa14a3d [Sclerotinia trifoliorum]
MSPSKKEMRAGAVAFCQAFVDGFSPGIISSGHFASEPRITEHGPESSELPFLGKTFSGRKSESSSNQTRDDYFTFLSKSLKFESSPTTSPSPKSFIVDETCEINGRKVLSVLLEVQLSGA